MPLEREIWEETVQEKLLEDNSGYRLFQMLNSNIVNGKIVHIPQAGAPSKVEKNRQTLPAQVKQRKDAEVLYVIDEYTTDPIHISNADTKELSYDNVEASRSGCRKPI